MQTWPPAVLFVPTQGGLCRGWCELLIYVLLCVAALPWGTHMLPGVPSPKGSLLRSGGAPRIRAARMFCPTCPLFCLLSLCRETPQGLFLPALSAFGAGAVTKGARQPAPWLKLELDRGWGGVKSPCASWDGALSGGTRTWCCRHSAKCPCCAAAAAARQPCGSRRRLRGEWDARLFLEQ